MPSCAFQAETRAEFAERSVAKLEKTIDDLEGIQHSSVASSSASTNTRNIPAGYIYLQKNIKNDENISNDISNDKQVNLEVYLLSVVYKL